MAASEFYHVSKALWINLIKSISGVVQINFGRISLEIDMDFELRRLTSSLLSVSSVVEEITVFRKSYVFMNDE